MYNEAAGLRLLRPIKLDVPQTVFIAVCWRAHAAASSYQTQAKPLQPRPNGSRDAQPMAMPTYIGRLPATALWQAATGLHCNHHWVSSRYRMLQSLQINAGRQPDAASAEPGEMLMPSGRLSI
jgi:hypothetical protein